MSEVLKRIPFSALKKLRKEFGPGIAGKNAFRIIAKGASCEGLSGGKKCDKKAERTIDFDAPRVNELVQIASCIDCQPKIMNKVIKDCSRWGNIPSFGTNGKGRS